MAEKKTDDQQQGGDQQAAAETKEAKPKRGEPTIVLTFEGSAALAGTTLSIGHESFDIQDGKVEVPTRLIEAARVAGFR